MSTFGTNSASPAACQPCSGSPSRRRDPNKHWIEIELVHEDDGLPVPNEEYVIRLPNGASVRGCLDAEGLASVSGIDDPGSADVTFPRLEKAVWDEA